MNRMLYAIGGFNGHDRLRTVEVFDLDQNKWTEVKFKKMNRHTTLFLVKSLRLHGCPKPR